MVPDWAVYPAVQLAAAHGGAGAVQDLEQSIFPTAAKVGIKLQIAARGGIYHDCSISTQGGQAVDMGQGRALGFLHISQQAAGCADGGWQVFAIKAVQVASPELACQAGASSRQVELPQGAAPYTDTISQRFGVADLITEDKLCRVDSMYFTEQGIVIGKLDNFEAAAGEFQAGQAIVITVQVHGGNEVVPAGIQQ